MNSILHINYIMPLKNEAPLHNFCINYSVFTTVKTIERHKKSENVQVS